MRCSCIILSASIQDSDADSQKDNVQVGKNDAK